MTLEDPFFIVKDEVVKAVTRTKGLYQRWCELQEENVGTGSGKEELEWTTTELRNSLRSIEWDLEDLDETVTIVQRNPKKFRIEDGEITSRKSFIELTKQDVQGMKEKINQTRNKDRERRTRQPLLTNGTSTNGGPRTARYTRLENEVESPSSPDKDFTSQTQQHQQVLVRNPDEQLDLIQDSVGTLRTMSRQIGQELDEQAIMLDEFAHELDASQSKLTTTMRKMAKFLHMSNDRIQWLAIGFLSCIMIVILLVFFAL